MSKRMTLGVALMLTVTLLSGAKCDKKPEPINQGRIIEKNHYLQGETRECKKSIFPKKECELGDPVQFPERCTFVIEEYETHRTEEVEVGCDLSFENANVGDSWTRPGKDEKGDTHR